VREVSLLPLSEEGSATKRVATFKAIKWLMEIWAQNFHCKVHALNHHTTSPTRLVIFQIKSQHVDDTWAISLALGPKMVWGKPWKLAFPFPSKAELEGLYQLALIILTYISAEVLLFFKHPIVGYRKKNKIPFSLILSEPFQNGKPPVFRWQKHCSA
jgi:hypothetical protein